MPANYHYCLLFTFLIAAVQSSAQVEDLTMDPTYTQYGVWADGFSSGFGPRNYIPNGSFNFGSYSCNSLGDGGWWFNPIGRWLGYQNNSCPPYSMIAPGTNWPYNINFYCDFDTEYNFHPASQEFHGGYLKIQVARLYNGQHRYNYILVSLTKPLTPGVEYAFSMQVTKDYASNQLFTAAVDRIGAVLLNELPDTLIEYGGLTDLEPFITTPAGYPVKVTDVFTLQDTVIGAGQKYLLVGVFAPFEEFTTDPVEPHPEAWTATYLFDNFKLYRAHCGNAISSVGEPVVVACAGDELQITAQYGTPPLAWSVNGVPAGNEDEITVVVPAADTMVVRLVGDTGACSDTAYAHIWARRLIVGPVDTTIFCADPMELALGVHHVNVNESAATGWWSDLAGNPLSEPNWQFHELTVNDPGAYLLHTTFNGCTQIDTIHVGPAPLLATTDTDQPLLLPEVRPEHCVNMNDGAIIIHDQGYPGTLTFDWYEPAYPDAHDTLAGIGEGNYKIRVYDDALRCAFWDLPLALMLDSCTMVSGTVTISEDLACDTPDDDLPVPSEAVIALPSGNMAFTDVTGAYSFFLPPGTSTLARAPVDIWIGNLCGNGTEVMLPFAGMMTEAHFVDTVHIPINDLAVSMITSNIWAIGNLVQVSVVVHNAGELPAQAILHVHIPQPHTVLVDFDGEYLGTSGDTLIYDLGVLQPGDQLVKHLTVNIPVVPDLIGTGVPVHASLVPVDGEIELANNDHTVAFTLMGAYDPNDKQVSPVGALFTSFTPVTERKFTYTVRFQNTGNYHATRVLIADTLHPLLDHASLQILHATHDVHAFVYDGVLYLDHNGIMLPDSTSDPEGSQGQVVFSIEAKPEADLGDEISNTAYIYFDLNPPIITNTVINVYGDLITSINEPPSLPSIQLWPDGVEGFSYRVSGSDSTPTAIRIIDPRGALIRILPAVPGGNFSTSGFHSGIYALVVSTGKGEQIARFVVAR